MSNIFNLDCIKDLIAYKFKQEIERIREEIIEDAVDELTASIRAKTGCIASEIFQRFDFRQNEHVLCITVDFKNLGEVNKP